MFPFLLEFSSLLCFTQSKAYHSQWSRSRFFFSGIPLLFPWSSGFGNLISDSSICSKPSLNIWNSQFTYCWGLAGRILSITLLACEMSAIVWQFVYYLALPFFGIGMKTDIFQSCGHCWVFQICCHIECSSFTASSFRIWNSSAEILSPPLALFVVMLPKAHLASHSRMSGSRWLITPSWLSGLWRSFLYRYCGFFLPPLLNIFCFC